jgi:hypothetical protein
MEGLFANNDIQEAVKQSTISSTRAIRAKKFEFLAFALGHISKEVVVSSWQVTGIRRALFNEEPPEGRDVISDRYESLVECSADDDNTLALQVTDEGTQEEDTQPPPRQVPAQPRVLDYVLIPGETRGRKAEDKVTKEKKEKSRIARKPNWFKESSLKRSREFMEAIDE